MHAMYRPLTHLFYEVRGLMETTTLPDIPGLFRAPARKKE